MKRSADDLTRKMSVVILSSMLLIVGSCSRTELIPESVTILTTQYSENTTEASTISVTHTEFSVETTTETEFTTTLPYMRSMQYDGEHIPDGIYLFQPISIDRDRLGCTANICAFYYLLEEDLEYLNEGDEVYWGDESHVCSSIDSDNQSASFDVCLWGLSKIANDAYAIVDFDTGQECATYVFAENCHVDIAEDVYIFDGLPFMPFKFISEDTHKAYLNGYYPSNSDGSLIPLMYEEEAILHNERPNEIELSMSFRYKSIDDFVYACNELSIWGRGICPRIVVVINDQSIQEMYINPALHQPWRYVSAENRHTLDSNERSLILIEE